MIAQKTLRKAWFRQFKQKTFEGIKGSISSVIDRGVKRCILGVMDGRVKGVMYRGVKMCILGVMDRGVKMHIYGVT